MSAILTSIQSLLSDPNPASPANAEASQLYESNRHEYNVRIQEVVENSWLDDPDAVAAADAAVASNSASVSGGGVVASGGGESGTNVDEDGA